LATGFPFSTGDILTAAAANGLVAFTVSADQTADYTAVLADSYQALVVMNKATAVAFKIPTDASVNFAVGTAITIYNKGAGAVTVSAVTSGTTTVVSAGAVPAAPTLAQYKTCVAIKLAANSWTIVGAVA
jgi:hypothetical protein